VFQEVDVETVPHCYCRECPRYRVEGVLDVDHDRHLWTDGAADGAHLIALEHHERGRYCRE
jgi:hypothetical protein